MPVNEAGKHFSRPADMNRASAMAPDLGDDGDPGDEQIIEIKKKADGSYCTVENGEEVEHPDLASAVAQVSSTFEPQDEQGAAPAMPGAEEAEEY